MSEAKLAEVQEKLAAADAELTNALAVKAEAEDNLASAKVAVLKAIKARDPLRLKEMALQEELATIPSQELTNG